SWPRWDWRTCGRRFRRSSRLPPFRRCLALGWGFQSRHSLHLDVSAIAPTLGLLVIAMGALGPAETLRVGYRSHLAETEVRAPLTRLRAEALTADTEEARSALGAAAESSFHGRMTNQHEGP